MTFAMKPLPCDPSRVRGMSERLIISHYENNYGGAVKRLNLIAEKLAELDPANAAGFLINGLKREELIAMGKALGGGSGWVLLSWSPRDRKLVNQWASDHCHSLAGGTPILALDMYEHSYHIDFGAKAATYVDTFMDAIRWDNVGRLYAAAAGAAGSATGA